MTHPELDLGRLLAPVGEADFFRDHWEKQPLFVRREQPGYYQGLFSTADIDPVIAFTRPKFAAGTVAPDDRRARSFVQGGLADEYAPEDSSFPGIGDLHQAYSRGKTVAIRAVQRRWPPVALLCRTLEAALHCPVHANMYLTPEGAQGFDAHFDTHEVFVLQLEGTKTWRVYGAARKLPLVEERFTGPKDALGPPREIRLEPGDLLYLPRGVVHEAFTADAASLHLTIGVNVYRWADLLHEALAAAARDDERFRASVPPGVLLGADPAAALAARARDLLGVLAQAARPEDAARSLADQFFDQLPVLPNHHFGPPPAADGINPDTVLEKSPGILCRVVQTGSWVEIRYPGGQVGGPLKIASALRFVAAARRFTARSLPDDLGGDAKLVLARRLVRERLLVVARPDDAGGTPADGARPSIVDP